MRLTCVLFAFFLVLIILYRPLSGELVWCSDLRAFFFTNLPLINMITLVNLTTIRI